VGESEYFRIKVVDHNNPTDYDYSGYFTITYPPSISIVSPRSDTVWQEESTYQITWTSNGPITSVDIHLFKGSDGILNVAERTSNDGSRSFTIPQSLTESSSYRILIVDSDNSGVYDWSDYFKIEKSSNNDDGGNDDNNNDNNYSEYDSVPGFNMIIVASIITIIIISIIKYSKKRLSNNNP
jgi:hypothetical protein